MSRIYFKQIQLLVRRLLVAYLLYFISRVLFYLANASFFSETSAGRLLLDCFYGLRFDSFSIVISNSLFILLSLLPFQFFYRPGYQKMLHWLFVVFNSVFLAFNYIDVGYFRFIKKRSSFELFQQLGGQTDMANMLPQFARDFWWILLLYVVSVWLTAYLYKRIAVQQNADRPKGTLKGWLVVSSLFLFSAGLAVLGARGGLQRVPIDVVNAGSVAKPEEVPIVLNTPFTLLKSMDQKGLEPYKFYDPGELATIYNPVHQFRDSTFRKLNVVVLILESFSKEYTRLGGRKSMTPFLDSLMDKSLVFTNGFSNGTKSIEGIPAILSGLPSLMENPFINSSYANNFQTSFASLLQPEGYTTAFFHGGINGTMNFDDWAASAGYDKYFGRNEYGNDKDFDGFWGIFDEPFLQYSVEKMSAFKEPFHSAIFTLSSHHPYLVPEQYKNRFPRTALENSESIGYADYALRRFFESARTKPWYRNTLFVLTADHTSLSEDPFFFNTVGYFTIPILFFSPDNSLAATCGRAFSQMDILPSAMNLLGYNKPFFAFGESYLSKAPGGGYSYVDAAHYLYTDSMAYNFAGANLNLVYNYRRDSLLTRNTKGNHPKIDSLYTRRFRAFLQTYNNALINNGCRLK